ncbi:hypothetical protein EV424DRAFT_1346327 [Suillus variegatus]|nr:hypothetical protein EV424DRAFT_1346327 [Suillus variegatus]
MHIHADWAIQGGPQYAGKSGGPTMKEFPVVMGVTDGPSKCFWPTRYAYDPARRGNFGWAYGWAQENMHFISEGPTKLNIRHGTALYSRRARHLISEGPTLVPSRIFFGLVHVQIISEGLPDKPGASVGSRKDSAREFWPNATGARETSNEIRD